MYVQYIRRILFMVFQTSTCRGSCDESSSYFSRLFGTDLSCIPNYDRGAGGEDGKSDGKSTSTALESARWTRKRAHISEFAEAAKGKGRNSWFCWRSQSHDWRKGKYIYTQQIHINKVESLKPTCLVWYVSTLHFSLLPLPLLRNPFPFTACVFIEELFHRPPPHSIVLLLPLRATIIG